MKNLLKQLEELKASNSSQSLIEIKADEIIEKQDRIDGYVKAILSNIRIDGQTRGVYNIQVEVPVVWDIAEAMEAERDRRMKELYNCK